MAIDTPAKIAILGAGPIGLEAGLYARFLGYDVEIFERGNVADNVARWGHVRMFSPVGMNCSPLGLASLQAQDANFLAPNEDELLTGREWLERYLLPLSQTDLLADHVRTQTTVLSVAREQLLKHELLGAPARGESPFRILIEGSEGTQSDTTADVVIDTTGVYGNPNWLGPGGAPAIGETDVRERIEYGVPDILGQQRDQYAGCRVLLVGSGYSAATSVVALAQLAEKASGTRVTWVTRKPGADGQGPIKPIDNDRLDQRAQLTVAANRCAASVGTAVTHRPDTIVHAIDFDSDAEKFSVELRGSDPSRFEFDRVIANVGYRPQDRIYAELQVHQCYASAGPMKLAAALLGAASADCLDQTSHGPQALLNPEPNFYLLGAKSYGRNSNFLVQIGLQQIRELFTLIGDREELDLYKGAVTILKQ